MSVIRCDNCEHQLDSDFVEFELYKDKEVCIDCFNEIRGDEEPDYDVENYFDKRARELEKFNLKGNMKTLEQIKDQAIKDYNYKVDRFISDSLEIDINPNFLTRIKLKFKRVKIIRQDMGYLREKISIYQKGRLTDEAEFNIKII